MIGILRLTTLVFLVNSLATTAVFVLRPEPPDSLLGFLRAVNDNSLLVDVVRELRSGSEITPAWIQNPDMEIVNPQSDAPPSIIYISKLETERLRWLSDNTLPGTVPVVSPDGTLIAASLALPSSEIPATQSQPIPALYLIDLETSDSQLIWVGVAGQLSWSPEGDYLAFELVSRVGNDRSIWLYERSTGDVYTVTEPGLQEVSPAWVRYRGRPFEAGFLLAVDAGLLLLLWHTGERPNKKGDL